MRDTRCDSASWRRVAHSQVLRAGVRRRSMNSPMVCMPARRDSAMSDALVHQLESRQRLPKNANAWRVLAFHLAGQLGQTVQQLRLVVAVAVRMASASAASSRSA
jgi:hypothetical protein